MPSAAPGNLLRSPTSLLPAEYAEVANTPIVAGTIGYSFGTASGMSPAIAGTRRFLAAASLIDGDPGPGVLFQNREIAASGGQSYHWEPDLYHGRRGCLVRTPQSVVIVSRQIEYLDGTDPSPLAVWLRAFVVRLNATVSSLTARRVHVYLTAPPGYVVGAGVQRHVGVQYPLLLPTIVQTLADSGEPADGFATHAARNIKTISQKVVGGRVLYVFINPDAGEAGFYYTNAFTETFIAGDAAAAVAAAERHDRFGFRMIGPNIGTGSQAATFVAALPSALNASDLGIYGDGASAANALVANAHTFFS